MGSHPSAEQVVLNFFSRWAISNDDLTQSFREFFDAETVWENVGICTTIGPDEAIALLAQFPFDIATIRVEIVSIATAPCDVVLTERIDHCYRADGTIAVVAKVAGVFAVHRGKITSWRDYFDTAAMAPRAT